MERSSAGVKSNRSNLRRGDPTQILHALGTDSLGIRQGAPIQVEIHRVARVLVGDEGQQCTYGHLGPDAFPDFARERLLVGLPRFAPPPGELPKIRKDGGGATLGDQVAPIVLQDRSNHPNLFGAHGANLAHLARRACAQAA